MNATGVEPPESGREAVAGWSTQEQSAGVFTLSLSGCWSIYRPFPTAPEVFGGLGVRGDRPSAVALDCSSLGGWDSSLLVFLTEVEAYCAGAGIELRRGGIPEGVRRLLSLHDEVPEREGARRAAVPASWLGRVGAKVLTAFGDTRRGLEFLGEICLALSRLLRGRVRFRGADFGLFVQSAGVDALPIVTLISLLVGLILAYIGAVQLEYFGAQIFVADLVALGMTREMGAMMTAIIMAGRTGAAYAAELGSQKVSEEIDALTTLGIPVIDYLVVPRLLALVLMIPLLTLYSDFLGMLGGAMVGIGLMDLGFQEYLQRTRDALELRHFFTGLFKALVYAVLIAVAGCMRGMQCGNSASSVGAATTSAVVTAIVWIVMASALLTVVYSLLGV